MRSSRTCSAAAAYLLALTCMLFSACRPEGERTLRQDSATASDGTVNVRIGMTGLILMVPPTSAAGATELFMPNASNHVAYLGFYQASNGGCDAFNKAFKICFVKLDGSRLEAIGRAGESGGRQAIPKTVLNLSSGTGPRAKMAGIEARSRARATLLSGSGVETCGLAEWDFDPPGDPPKERLELTNGMTWTMNALPGDRLELVRRPLAGNSPAERRLTVPARVGRGVELLLLHIPEGEFEALVAAERGSGTMPENSFDPVAVKRDFAAHLYHVYRLMDAPANVRPLPTEPFPVHHICPIRVLDLQNAVYPTGASGDSLFVRKVNFGVRTFSCVMTSADAG